jgi:F420-dependent oxidoreductase-like protein
MEFGIHNPSWLFGPDPYQAFEALKEKARWCERHGFRWFSVMDHLIQIPGVGAPEEPFLEGWTTLAALAAVTERIRLGTLVSSVAYRNPALLAKMTATIDVISRGRVTLGIGAGWFRDEYRQYNWEFPERPATRIAQLAEAVRLIKTMWTEPRATFQGRYFKVDNAILEPKPVQRPHPPILIGGGGEQLTLRAVARHADACNVFGDPAAVRHKYEVLRRHCEAAGRPVEAVERTCLTSLVLARDEAGLQAARARLGVPEQFRGQALTVPQAVDRLGEYRDAGTQLFICSLHKNDRESLELLGTEVMPQLRGR